MGIHLVPDRQSFSGEQLSRLKELNSTTIFHANVKRCLNFLEDIFETSNLGRESGLYTVFGPPGVSKSVSVIEFQKRHPHFETSLPDGRSVLVQPVVRIEVIPKIGKNGLWCSIIEAVGQSRPGIPRGGDKLRILARDVLKLHQVRVLIIDEAQNLTFNRTEHAVVAANEILRNLVNENVCQIVLVGANELADFGNATQSAAIEAVERQLSRRLMGSLAMPLFNAKKMEDRLEFGGIIKRLEESACSSSDRLSLTDYIDEIFEATEGSTARLVKLINAAAILSYKDKQTFILKEHLLKAFSSLKGERAANPFGLPAFQRKLQTEQPETINRQQRNRAKSLDLSK